MKYLFAFVFITVVGTAAFGMLLNGSPGNVAAAAILVIALIEFTRPVWRGK